MLYTRSSCHADQALCTSSWVYKTLNNIKLLEKHWCFPQITHQADVL